MKTTSRHGAKFKVNREGPEQAALVTVVRFLMTATEVNNGCRSGVLQNMLIAEFEAGKLMGGTFTIFVANHKT